MNGDDRFDSVARSFASPTRRGVLLLAAAAVWGLGGILGWSRAESGSGGTKRTRKRGRNRERRQRRRRSDVAAGPALYPDLRTQQLVELRFAQLVDGTHVLRFTNEVWNAGDGPIELEAPSPKKRKKRRRDMVLYQNLYDAPVDGRRSARRRVHGRIIFHADHGHYHFADFAKYELLECGAAGDCELIGESPKVSFCLVDSELVAGSHPRQYTVCELKEPQGITPGYSDVYAWNLPDQWVVLQDGPLADGEYALRSTADPGNQLNEGGGERELNNAAVVYFTVDSGQLGNARDTR